MQTDTFRLVTTGSITGLVIVTALITSSATSKYASWWKQERERSEAQNAKAIADTYRENQIAHFEQLIVNNYTLNNTPPHIDWQRSVDPSKKTYIYDRYRKCVGYALNGKLYFTLYYKGVCN
jgi:hypothetical protein